MIIQFGDYNSIWFFKRRMRYLATLIFLITFCQLYSQDSTLNGYQVFYKTPFIETIQPKVAKDGGVKVYRKLGVPFFLIPRRKPDIGLNGKDGIAGDDFEVYLRNDTLGLTMVRIRNVDKLSDPDIVFYIDLSKTYLKLTFRGGDGGNGAKGGDWISDDRDKCLGMGGAGGDGGNGGRVGMIDVYFDCDTSNVKVQAIPGQGGLGGIGGNRSFNNGEFNCSGGVGANGRSGRVGEKINDVAFIPEVMK